MLWAPCIVFNDCTSTIYLCLWSDRIKYNVVYELFIILFTHIHTCMPWQTDMVFMTYELWFIGEKTINIYRTIK